MKSLFVHFVLHSVSVSVLHAVYSVPMSTLVGLMVPRRPLVAELSFDERALVWTLLIESGSRFARYSEIAVETFTDPCD